MSQWLTHLQMLLQHAIRVFNNKFLKMCNRQTCSYNLIKELVILMSKLNIKVHIVLEDQI